MPTNRYSQEGQEQPQQKEGKNQTRQVYARFLFLDCIKYLPDKNFLSFALHICKRSS